MSQNRLIFYTSPPTLPELASTSFTINLWQCELQSRWSSGKVSQICELFSTFCQDDVIPLPSRVRTMINHKIETIRKEIEAWIVYHFNRIFERKPIRAIKFLINFLENVIWLPNGTINYESSAKNMLQSDQLTEEEKYAVACTYCFEEDISKLRPLQNQTSYSDNIGYIRHFLIHYSDYRLIDRISMIPNDLTDFFETNIMDWPAIDNWPAIRYFWNHLNDNDRANQAVRIIARYKDAKFTPYILTELTEQQFHYVVEQTASFMMLRMINNPKLTEYAFQTWLHVRHIINEDQFFELIQGILNTKIRYSETFSNDEVSLRVKIWSTASDHLKQTALIHLINENTSFEYRGSLEKLPREMIFLLNILADASFSQRNFLWRNNWSNLIYGTNPLVIEHLMTMCLADPKDIVAFKEQIFTNFANIQKYCMELAEERLFSELNDFLQFCCSSNPEKILSLKHKILQSCFSNETLIFNYHILRDLRKLDEFIDDVFQNDLLAQNYKKQIVLLPANFQFVQYVIENGDLSLVKNLFSSFLPFEPDLTWIKAYFLDLCRSSLDSDNFWKFEMGEWREFIMWCAGNEHKIQKFKKSIPLDRVFETILTRCFEFQNHTHSCNIYTECDNDLTLYKSLNNFLSWYFDCPEKVRRFKSNKIHRYHEIEILNRIFTEGGECIVKDTLEWFFNGDSQAVERFRMTIRHRID